MLKRLLCAAMILCWCLLFPASSLALDASDTFAGNISITASDGGEWRSVPVVVLYAHENGRLADGLLMFIPLADFLAAEHVDIPVFRLTEDFAYCITTTDHMSSFSCHRTLLLKTEEGYLPLETDELSAEALAPGTYLLLISCDAARGEEYFAGYGMLWLDCGTAE